MQHYDDERATYNFDLSIGGECDNYIYTLNTAFEIATEPIPTGRNFNIEPLRGCQKQGIRSCFNCPFEDCIMNK